MADVVGISSAVIALLSLVVAYVTYRRGEKLAEQASRQSFQATKNDLKVEIIKQQFADQRVMQEALAAAEEFRLVAEQVEALGVPQFSDGAREFKVDVLRELTHLENNSPQGELQNSLAIVDELTADMATSESLERLRDCEGTVRHLATLSEEYARRAAGMTSTLREASDFYREQMAEFTEEDDVAPAEDNDTVE